MTTIVMTTEERQTLIEAIRREAFEEAEQKLIYFADAMYRIAANTGDDGFNNIGSSYRDAAQKVRELWEPSTEE